MGRLRAKTVLPVYITAHIRCAHRAARYFITAFFVARPLKSLKLMALLTLLYTNN